MPSAQKMDLACNSSLLFIGSTTLRPSSPAILEQLPDATASLSLEVIGPPGYRVDLENLMLFLDITDPTPATVRFVQHPATNYHWGLPQNPDTPPGMDGWNEDTHKPYLPTRRLRGRKDHDKVWSGAANGSTYWVGVNGLDATESLSFTAYAMAEKTVATTNGCLIQMKDFHLDDVLTGTWG
ncbi:hypothetical protein AB0M29_25495 [Streptomyces sp. NPDC051976]|uniref:hypothetical protein n=1 Tax=Streptomyces sp. NPDC051976 TaxID=3154947 RepID=UPI00343F655D